MRGAPLKGLSSAVFRLAFLLTFYSIASFAQGGPPMITDDPGTPGAGNWRVGNSRALPS